MTRRTSGRRGRRRVPQRGSERPNTNATESMRAGMSRPVPASARICVEKSRGRRQRRPSSPRKAPPPTVRVAAPPARVRSSRSDVTSQYSTPSRSSSDARRVSQSSALSPPVPTTTTRRRAPVRRRRLRRPPVEGDHGANALVRGPGAGSSDDLRFGHVRPPRAQNVPRVDEHCRHSCSCSRRPRSLSPPERPSGIAGPKIPSIPSASRS